MLTDNEIKILRLLMTSFDRDYSINNIAKECNLSPNGALKILKKFEREDIFKTKKIANIISYKLNFENEKTANIVELALMPELKEKAKHRLEDFKELKEITKSCILFGSYISEKKESHDLDVLFILEKKNFKKYKKKLIEIKHVVPAEIHDVLQTEEDLKNNLLKKDNVILEILNKGIILWGQKTIVNVIKNVYQR